MVTELARFFITHGQEEDFVAAYQAARTYLENAEGYRGHHMHRVAESPSDFVLIVSWDSLDAHVKGFRESEAYVEWRRLIGPYFSASPEVVHLNQI